MLDPSQEVAALSDADATLVLAGPGAGKTAMLARRLCWLAGERGVDPRRILCLTFTRAAAAEMLVRARAASAGAGRAAISTFHGFCWGLLQSEYREFGFSAPPRLVGDDERIAEAAGAIGRRVEIEDAERFDLARERGVAGLQSRANRFEEALTSAGAVDFAALAGLVRKVSGTSYGAALARRFDHVLIDEYQDSSQAQENLIRMLVSGGARLWCVGDDDQSLYGFRAAEEQRVLGFEARFSGARVVTTEMNYRSEPGVVAASGSLIGFNARRREKAQRAVRERALGAGARAFSSEDGEARAIGEGVAKLLLFGAAPARVAILARTWQTARAAAAFAPPGVAAMTVHAAKGREWDYVYVAGMEEGTLPAAGCESLEEERRVAYVAMTRARLGLVLTGAYTRTGARREVSRFVVESGLAELGMSGCAMPLGEAGAAPISPKKRYAPFVASRGECRGGVGDVGRLSANLRGGRPRNTGVSWSLTDEAGLRNMAMNGSGPGAIAVRLQRTSREITFKLKALGMEEAARREG